VRKRKLHKETPVPVPASTQATTPAVATTTQAEDDHPPRPVPRRTGQRIDSGTESEEVLQMAAEDKEEALNEEAVSTLLKKSP
jgi:hypothetical protein